MFYDIMKEGRYTSHARPYSYMDLTKPLPSSILGSSRLIIKRSHFGFVISMHMATYLSLHDNLNQEPRLQINLPLIMISPSCNLEGRLQEGEVKYL